MFALKSPGGHLLHETTAQRRKDVWTRAERFFRLQHEYRSLRDYQSAARRRGYQIVEVVLVEANVYRGAE